MGLALFALTLTGFLLFAVIGLYFRLRSLENRGGGGHFVSTRDAPRVTVPLGDLARGDISAAVLLLDATCPSCASFWSQFCAIPTTLWRIGLVSSSDDLAHFQSAPSAQGSPVVTVNREVWAAIYEGYCPAIALIGTDGELYEREFLYVDSDLASILDRFERAIAHRPDAHRETVHVNGASRDLTE